MDSVNMFTVVERYFSSVSLLLIGTLRFHLDEAAHWCLLERGRLHGIFLQTGIHVARVGHFRVAIFREVKQTTSVSAWLQRRIKRSAKIPLLLPMKALVKLLWKAKQERDFEQQNENGERQVFQSWYSYILTLSSVCCFQNVEKRDKPDI